MRDDSRRQSRAFWTLLVFGALLVPLAIVPAIFLDIDLAGLFRATPANIIVGVLGAAPPLALLVWFMASRRPSVVRFRESQFDFFRRLGFELTLFRNALLSVVAGVGEELLFRGILQTVADRHLPVAAAILLPNLLFGALHARTKLYAIAAFAVGAWLGALYWLTESLATPIIAHALYDFIALEWARRILTKKAIPTPPPVA